MSMQYQNVYKLLFILLDNKIIIMKKTRKYLRFEQLKIELTNEHPKEISRALLCFTD